eukprot:1420220-Rhodomonas_salina.3
MPGFHTCSLRPLTAPPAGVPGVPRDETNYLLLRRGGELLSEFRRGTSLEGREEKTYSLAGASLQAARTPLIHHRRHLPRPRARMAELSFGHK